jgi:hypothetical protein
MGKRKLFLLFLSAMSVSIIIMVIVYGLFIKDLDFTFNVKNPEMAPSPMDIFDQSSEDFMAEDSRSPARVQTPDEANANDKTNEDNGLAQADHEDEEGSFTDVVPLEPHVGVQVEEPVIPGMLNDSGNKPGGSPSRVGIDALPSLHYVFMDGFSSREAAEDAVQQLQGRGLAAQPYVRMHKGQIILQFGVFSDKENAEVLAQQLRTQNVFVKVD